jgi:hypothetical protein
VTGNRRLRDYGGCDRPAEDTYFSITPDPTFTFVGGLCCPTLEFVLCTCIMGGGGVVGVCVMVTFNTL